LPACFVGFFKLCPWTRMRGRFFISRFLALVGYSSFCFFLMFLCYNIEKLTKKFMKTKQFIYVIIVVVIIVALSYYFYDSTNKKAQAPTTDIEDVLMRGQNRQQTETDKTEEPKNQAQETAIPTTEAGGTFSSGSEAETSPGADILVSETVYDGKNFLPGSLEILVGDIVIFTNNSGEEFLPASGAHPEFGPAVALPAGGKYQFKFETADSWDFYDGLNPSATGVINVAAR